MSTDVRRITLLTDFGTADGYAAAMKGVIAEIAPFARVEDASHDVPPGDVRAAAWALRTYWRLYPEGTVHLVVVDPGVGTARRAVAAQADGRFVVAPDNGILTWILEEAREARVVRLENPAYRHESVSSTFHGRDIFAPAAAHLAAGVTLDALGPTVSDPVRFDVPAPVRDDHGAEGVVVHVDRFGTLITNLPGEWAGHGRVEVDGVDVGVVQRTFGDVASGRLLALIGSAGRIEVAVRDGSAAERLGVGRGTAVRLMVRTATLGWVPGDLPS